MNSPIRKLMNFLKKLSINSYMPQYSEEYRYFLKRMALIKYRKSVRERISLNKKQTLSKRTI